MFDNDNHDTVVQTVVQYTDYSLHSLLLLCCVKYNSANTPPCPQYKDIIRSTKQYFISITNGIM